MLTEKKWTLQYGEKRLGDTKGYAVVSPDGKRRLQFDSKQLARMERDKLNA